MIESPDIHDLYLEVIHDLLQIRGRLHDAGLDRESEAVLEAERTVDDLRRARAKDGNELDALDKA